MPALYQVVFTGSLLPNVGTEQAARDFAAVFKVPEEKAWRLVLSGTEHVLKRDIDQANAERYRQLLDEIGLAVRVEPMPAAGEATGADALSPVEPALPAASDRAVPVAEAFGLGDGRRVTGANADIGADRGADDRADSGASQRGGADRNPYTPPRADLERAPARGAGADQMIDPQALPAGHGWTWISGGWELFKQAPLQWVAAFVLYLVVLILVSLVPIVGGLISNLFGPVLIGGFMYGADRQARGQGFEIGHLFYGFTSRFGPLVGLGAIYLLALFAVVLVLVIVMVALMAGASGFDPAAFDQDPELLFEALGPMAVLLFALVFLAALIPLMMAYWFAPTLVMLGEMGPLAAMQLSLRACLRNIVPFLVYGLVGMLMFLIGALPFGLGLLVVVPILLAANYVAYREIFFANARPPRGRA